MLAGFFSSSFFSLFSVLGFPFSVVVSGVLESSVVADAVVVDFLFYNQVMFETALMKLNNKTILLICSSLQVLPYPIFCTTSLTSRLGKVRTPLTCRKEFCRYSLMNSRRLIESEAKNSLKISIFE